MYIIFPYILMYVCMYVCMYMYMHMYIFGHTTDQQELPLDKGQTQCNSLCAMYVKKAPLKKNSALIDVNYPKALTKMGILP